jgi:hypothetical protein
VSPLGGPGRGLAGAERTMHMWRLVRGERFCVRIAGEYEVSFVIRHMSARCALEAFASRPDDDRERMAREFCALLPALKIFVLGLEVPDYPVRFEPMALISAGPVAVGVGTMLWIATDDWPLIALPTHRWFFRVFRPTVMGKYRRVEFMGGADPVSRRWCASVGFTEEGTAYKYGKRGEDFVYFAWLNPEWRDV